MHVIRIAVSTAAVVALAAVPRSQPPAAPGAAQMACPPRVQSSATGRIRGRVMTEGGVPVRRAQVRMFGGESGPRTATTDADGRYEIGGLSGGRYTASNRWRLPSSRWIARARPDDDGRYRVRGMPAGSYRAIAVDYLSSGEWSNPEVLERLKQKAQRFSLSDAERKTLDLTIAVGG